MPPTPRDVTVVGAGVIGLSCSIRLAEAGHRVTVVTDRVTADTTFAMAAALWYPYLASPPERVRGWAARSYDVFRSVGESATGSGAGLRLLKGRELLYMATPDPIWVDAVPDFRRLDAENFQSVLIERREDIWPAFKSFLARDKAGAE